VTARAWYVGLDLGPRTFTAAAAVRGAGGDVAALGSESVTGAGIDRGRIVDAAALRRSVEALLTRVTDRLDAEIASVALTIPGSPCRRVAASAERRFGTPNWIDSVTVQELRLQTLRVPAAAGTVLASRSWARVDGRRWPDSEPVGWGQRLRVDTEAWVVTPDYIAGYARMLAQLGFELDLLMPRVAAAAAVALHRTEMERGALAIDVGETETDVAAYAGGVLRALFNLPHGFATRPELSTERSLNPSRSTVPGRGRATPRGLAYGRPYSTMAALNGAVRGAENATVTDAGPLTSTPANLFRQIRRRLEELELQRFVRGGLVLIGDGARRPDTLAAAVDVLGLPARVGRPLGWEGGRGCADPALTAAIGLVLTQAQMHPDDEPPRTAPRAQPVPVPARASHERVGGLGRWLREFVPAGEGT